MKKLVGIDYDGTIFDTMNIKHKDVFWKVMVDMWKLHDEEKNIIDNAVYLNLFSVKRGINRFPGLLKVMESSEKISKSDKDRLKDFVMSDFVMSNSGLNEYINHIGGDDFLQKVLLWSQTSDKIFAEKTKNIKPFKYCAETIINMSKSADIFVISSASYLSIEHDMKECGLSDYLSGIMGQEAGNKRKQISDVLSRYDDPQMLMIGDAVSDFESAEKCGALFYPIRPGSETESWLNLKDKYFEMFINNRYDSEVQNLLYKDYLSVFNS